MKSSMKSSLKIKKKAFTVIATHQIRGYSGKMDKKSQLLQKILTPSLIQKLWMTKDQSLHVPSCGYEQFKFEIDRSISLASSSITVYLFFRGDIYKTSFNGGIWVRGNGGAFYYSYNPTETSFYVYYRIPSTISIYKEFKKE